MYIFSYKMWQLFGTFRAFFWGEYVLKIGDENTMRRTCPNFILTKIASAIVAV